MGWRAFLLRAVIVFPWTPCIALTVRAIDRANPDASQLPVLPSNPRVTMARDAAAARYDLPALAIGEPGDVEDGAYAPIRPKATGPETLRALRARNRSARGTPSRQS